MAFNEGYIQISNGTSMKSRDDFTKATKIQLLIRASNLCSRCRAMTVGPTHSGDRNNSIGVAAHICGAASGRGSKRYDANQTTEQRKHYDNGIWLCYSCSKLIDNEETFHDAHRLRSMKASHLAFVSTLVGLVLVAPFEVKKEIRAGIIEATLALCGNGAGKLDLTAVVEGYEEHLRSVDSNYDVEVIATNKQVKYNIAAKEGIIPNISIIPNADARSLLLEKYENLRLTGDDIVIPSEGIDFVGIDIFQEVKRSTPNSYLILKSKKHKIESELILESDSGSCSLGSFQSLLKGGRDVQDYSGRALNDFFQYQFIVDLPKAAATMEFGSTIESWIGKNISDFKHMPKLLKAHAFLEKSTNYKFLIECEIGSATLIIPKGVSNQPQNVLNFFRRNLKALYLLHEISKFLPDKITINSPVTTEKSIDIADFSLLLASKPQSERLEFGTLLLSIRLDEIPTPLAIDLWHRRENLYFSLTEQDNRIADIYGNLISFPRWTHGFENFTPAPYSSISESYRNCLFVNLYANEHTTLAFGLENDNFEILKVSG